ncbi:4715_t:CDS:2 [Dentiscutata erythropus]|uniref:4715_t:CDS:1 n=1 Tax=Dentiscutata erythropus TaxID=1348616 RepID=A0A9N9BIG8_9GLOM|nr:4715_t:CDS:2 [Dentiscutata erythropus]
MTAVTSASVSDIAKPPMSAMKRRSIIIPQHSNHRDKLKDAIKKRVADEIVELFVEAQQIGKDDTVIIKMILDHIKKRNTNSVEVLEWLLSNQHTLQYKTLLGYFYLHDIGTEIDTRKAYVLYLAAAKKDYPIAQYLLGECYSSGSGTKSDEKLAFQWYQKAAEGGCTNGYWNIKERRYGDSLLF